VNYRATWRLIDEHLGHRAFEPGTEEFKQAVDALCRANPQWPAKPLRLDTSLKADVARFTRKSIRKNARRAMATMARYRMEAISNKSR
jgi:hypothetical protein